MVNGYGDGGNEWREQYIYWPEADQYQTNPRPIISQNPTTYQLQPLNYEFECRGRDGDRESDQRVEREIKIQARAYC